MKNYYNFINLTLISVNPNIFIIVKIAQAPVKPIYELQKKVLSTVFTYLFGFEWNSHLDEPSSSITFSHFNPTNNLFHYFYYLPVMFLTVQKSKAENMITNINDHIPSPNKK